MRRLLLLALLPSLLLGAKILSYNVYDRSDRVDIMLSFDTPYEGALRQSRMGSRIVVKLEDASIESPKVKEVGSPYLGKLTLTPIGSETQIIATVPESVEMLASKTSDAFGLRLRFTKPAPAPVTTEPAAAAPSPVASLPTKPADDLTGSYIIVVVILLLGIFVLLWVKSRMATPRTAASGGKGWLFSKNGEKSDGVSVRFQKPLDPKNRIVMLDYGEESYLVLLGTTNMLLEKFHDRKPVTQSDFDTMLQDKHEELDRFLQIDHAREPLQSYKEKASGGDL